MQASEVITKTILYGSDFMQGGIFMLNQERDKHKLLTQSQKNIIGPSKHENQPHTLSTVCAQERRHTLDHMVYQYGET